MQQKNKGGGAIWEHFLKLDSVTLKNFLVIQKGVVDVRSLNFAAETNTAHCDQRSEHGADARKYVDFPWRW